MRYLVIDIETIPNEDDLAFECSLVKAPSNYRDQEKIDAYVAEGRKRAVEKAALKDSATVAMIGAKTDQDIVLFQCVPADPMLAGVVDIRAAENESDMFALFDDWLTMNCNPETELVTFNGRGFDLPKLRLGSVRSGMPANDRLFNRHTDLMLEYLSRYSVIRTPFVSLSEVVQRLGVLDTDKPGSGKLFPDLVRDGRHGEAAVYNLIDCLLTEQAYFRLGSRRG